MMSQGAQHAYVQVTELRPKHQTIIFPSLTAKEHCSLTHSNSTQGCSCGVAIFHYTRLISFDDQTFKKCERLELYFCLESSDDSWRSLSKVQFTLTNYTNLLKQTEREVTFPPLTVLYNLIAQL